MSYSIKEIFYSLQGEGFHAGRPAVFCRFSGCNLWSGRESNRKRSLCRFCDTDFVGCDGIDGGVYGRRELAEKIMALWREKSKKSAPPFVVLTGGEPLLQADAPLLSALHEKHFEIAVETNGTIRLPDGIDWVCVSPKAGTRLVVKSGHELKLVFPQKGAEPEKYATLDFQHFFLQPRNMSRRNIRQAVRYVLSHPQWRLSLQMQKILNIR